MSNCGSIRLRLTEGPPTFEPTTQVAPSTAARPVGVSTTGIVFVTLLVSGSIRETFWSSRFATQSEPEPEAIAPGRDPTDIASVTRFESGSITATAFPFTVTPGSEPPWPNAKIGIASAAASTPTRAEPAYRRRLLRRSSTSSVRSCANSFCSPSMSS